MLGAVMVISIIPGTALAMPTIDTGATGSLTIHKYEYNGEETGVDSTKQSTGTGSATDSVPSNATPLEDVTFRITFVAGLDNYYGTDAIALPTVDEAKGLIAAASSPATYEVTTNSSGVATQSNLPLGLYLVQEISAPAQITGKVEDFLVSIPMTNAAGNDWNYNVHVFPKNSSTYANVTLLKQGKIGNDAATNLQGATFVLQKCDDPAAPAKKWTTVTKNNKGAAIGTNGVLTTGTNGRISVSDLAPGTYRFLETGVPKHTGYIMDGVTAYEFVITDDGKVEISGAETDTTQNPITVVDYKPDVEKEVKDRTDGDWGTDSDYSAGDTVPYRITVDVPQNIDKLVDFTLSDTMDKLTYVADSLHIYSDADLQTEILTTDDTPDYTVDTASADWSIAFNHKDSGSGAITSLLKDYAGRTIYIYFEATLDADAVVTSAGNPNTVTLEYSNQILPDSQEDGNPNTPGEPKKDEIKDQAVVYTFKIAVVKVDGKTNQKLTGVTFDLYRKINDGENTSGITTVTNPVNGLTGTYQKINATALTTNAQGEINVSGLENGSYYLVETKTNDGYNLLKAPVAVELDIEYVTTTNTTTVTGDDGTTVTSTTVTNTKYEDAEGNNGTITTTVKNNTGFDLPATGGMGTILFSIIGIALVAGAVVILSRARKRV